MLLILSDKNDQFFLLKHVLSYIRIKMMILFFYNLLFPIVFIFFIPGMVVKLIKRGGSKENYPERFGIFSFNKKKKIESFSKNSPIWVHSVSVGETQLAIEFIKKWQQQYPKRNFIISTTTTTGQELAIKKAPENIPVFYCPVDFKWFVRKTIRLVNPSMLVIFETELWPNLIVEASKYGAKPVQVNARISDHSFKNYKRFRHFIAPFMSKLSISCAQTELDAKRLRTICPSLSTIQTGTMKFDQEVPGIPPEVDLSKYLGEMNHNKVLLAASTHPGEEELIISAFKNIKSRFTNLRLIIIPRHAERGAEVAKDLKENGISYFRKSNNNKYGKEPLDCLLADTTGEMLKFINCSDIIIMGKSFAGQNEGHNIIEPAIFGKPVITGEKMKNFKFVAETMQKNNAILSVKDEELEAALSNLLNEPEQRKNLAENAKNTVLSHKGATQKTINILEQLLEDRKD